MTDAEKLEAIRFLIAEWRRTWKFDLKKLLEIMEEAP